MTTKRKIAMISMMMMKMTERTEEKVPWQLI